MYRNFISRPKGMTNVRRAGVPSVDKNWKIKHHTIFNARVELFCNKLQIMSQCAECTEHSKCNDCTKYKEYMQFTQLILQQHIEDAFRIIFKLNFTLGYFEIEYRYTYPYKPDPLTIKNVSRPVPKRWSFCIKSVRAKGWRNVWIVVIRGGANLESFKIHVTITSWYARQMIGITLISLLK